MLEGNVEGEDTGHRTWPVVHIIISRYVELFTAQGVERKTRDITCEGRARQASDNIYGVYGKRIVDFLLNIWRFFSRSWLQNARPPQIDVVFRACCVRHSLYKRFRALMNV